MNTFGLGYFPTASVQTQAGRFNPEVFTGVSSLGLSDCWTSDKNLYFDLVNDFYDFHFNSNSLLGLQRCEC